MQAPRKGRLGAQQARVPHLQPREEATAKGDQVIEEAVIKWELGRLAQWDTSMKNAVKFEEFAKRLRASSRLVETDLVFGVDRLIDEHDGKGFRPAALLAACQAAARIRYENADNWDYDLPNILEIDEIHPRCGQQKVVNVKDGWVVCRHCSQNVVDQNEFGKPRVLPWTERQGLIELWRAQKEAKAKDFAAA